MHPSYASVQSELADMAVEVAHLSTILARLAVSKLQQAAQDRWEATIVCAAAAEKIYTGCERVMARIASEVDGVPVVHVGGWHLAVLKRMANSFLLARPAVISAETYFYLDRMRAFRHRERNSYGINLDYEIVVERAGEAVLGFRHFCREVLSFLEAAS